MIINSLLDVDFYKFTMGQFIFRNPILRDSVVTFKLKNRSPKRLIDNISIDELVEELDSVRTLRFTRSELHYLRGTNEYSDRMFQEDYLEFLATIKLPEADVSLDENGDIACSVTGPWAVTTYWETIIMSIINELRTKSIMDTLNPLGKASLRADMITRFSEKMNLLIEDAAFIDFGTRRRFSFEHQDRIVELLATSCFPNFRGTSNTYLAMKYGLLPMGTYAHELDMGYTALLRSRVSSDSPDEHKHLITVSHLNMMSDWYALYGEGLSVALTDTYGSEFFFKNFGYGTASEWKGVRHDSGDPVKFGKRVIDIYNKLGINPRTKLLIFSDGLNVGDIKLLHKTFSDYIKLSFGWGTDLTNDSRIGPTNIVVKMTELNGVGTVKLSDEPTKAMGTPSDVSMFMEHCCG